MAASQNEPDAQPTCQLGMSKNITTTSTNDAQSENRRWKCYILGPACIPLDTVVDQDLVCRSCMKALCEEIIAIVYVLFLFQDYTQSIIFRPCFSIIAAQANNHDHFMYGVHVWMRSKIH
ncbi:TPA: hypothetical protein ACH3X1_004660 [Trebouxia sp. C0004]